MARRASAFSRARLRRRGAGVFSDDSPVVCTAARLNRGDRKPSLRLLVDELERLVISLVSVDTVALDPRLEAGQSSTAESRRISRLEDSGERVLELRWGYGEAVKTAAAVPFSLCWTEICAKIYTLEYELNALLIQ